MNAIRKISINLRSYVARPIQRTRSIEPLLVIASLASSNRLDSLRTAPVGSGSLGGGADLASGAATAAPRRLTIRRTGTEKTTWATGC
jgi:hypothetical protein